MKTYSRLGKRSRPEDTPDATKRRRVQDAPDAAEDSAPKTTGHQGREVKGELILGTVQTAPSTADQSRKPAFSMRDWLKPATCQLPPNDLDDAASLAASDANHAPSTASTSQFASSPPNSASFLSSPALSPFLASSPPSSPPPDTVDSDFSETAWTTPASRTSALGRCKTPAARSPLVQMHFNLGPTLQKTCRDCGMTYVSSDKTDNDLHRKYHKRHLDGLEITRPFRKFAEKFAVWEGSNNCLITVVDRTSDAFVQRAAEQVLAVAQSELGAVAIPERTLWQDFSPYKAFIYLAGLRVVGLCLAKDIAVAHKTIPSSTDAIAISDDTEVASVGISRIWVSKSHRRAGIGKALLDSVARNFVPHSHVPCASIAFSQPTASGAKLARSWYGKQHGWLVYID